MTTPTKTPHSPLPWKGDASVIWSPSGKAVIAAMSELRTTSTVQFTPIDSGSSDADLNEAYANRDFILLAVNNHEKLVEALERIRRFTGSEEAIIARSVLASLSDGQEKEGK